MHPLVYSCLETSPCLLRIELYVRYYYYYFSAANAGGGRLKAAESAAPLRRQDTVWPLQLAVDVGAHNWTSAKTPPPAATVTAACISVTAFRVGGK